MTAGSAKIQITEIYSSLQGESTWVGVPMIFVRLTGCPLRCVWCDTEYAFTGGEGMEMEAVLKRVEEEKLPHVEVTGGEPLAQKACYDLLKNLCEAGKTVLLETAGSHDIAPVDRRVHVIMDLKAPGSGELKRNRWENLEYLKKDKDELKIVLNDRADYEWARSKIVELKLVERVKAILLAPVHGNVSGKELAEWILADGLTAPVRMQTQLHKHIWGVDAEGV